MLLSMRNLQIKAMYLQADSNSEDTNLIK